MYFLPTDKVSLKDRPNYCIMDKRETYFLEEHFRIIFYQSSKEKETATQKCNLTFLLKLHKSVKNWAKNQDSLVLLQDMVKV